MAKIKPSHITEEVEEDPREVNKRKRDDNFDVRDLGQELEIYQANINKESTNIRRAIRAIRTPTPVFSPGYPSDLSVTFTKLSFGSQEESSCSYFYFMPLLILKVWGWVRFDITFLGFC